MTVGLDGSHRRSDRWKESCDYRGGFMILNRIVYLERASVTGEEVVV